LRGLCLWTGFFFSPVFTPASPAAAGVVEEVESVDCGER